MFFSLRSIFRPFHIVILKVVNIFQSPALNLLNVYHQMTAWQRLRDAAEKLCSTVEEAVQHIRGSRPSASAGAVVKYLPPTPQTPGFALPDSFPTVSEGDGSESLPRAGSPDNAHGSLLEEHNQTLLLDPCPTEARMQACLHTACLLTACFCL